MYRVAAMLTNKLVYDMNSLTDLRVQLVALQLRKPCVEPHCE
jgi:hypothetical protein